MFRWNELLDRRQHNVLVSFGSITRSADMPLEYRNTIVRAVRAFPNVRAVGRSRRKEDIKFLEKLAFWSRWDSQVTFIWKYENASHGVSAGVPNLVEVEWAPQRDLLRK